MATTKSKHRVHGTVTDLQGFPLEELMVQVFDKDLRSEQLIGEIRTDRKGNYELRYDPKEFMRSEKKYPDLAVKVLSGDGKKLLFEPSMAEVRFNAKRTEHISVQLRQQVPRKHDEFTAYVTDTATVRGNLSIAALEENEKTKDLSFLSNECNIEEGHLHYLTVAHRLSEKYDIEPAFFYGLFRTETLMKREMADLLHVRFSITVDTALEPLFYDIVLLDEKTITKDIGKAIKEQRIKSGVKKELRSILAVLQKFREAAEKYTKETKKTKLLNSISSFVISDKLGKIGDLFAQANGSFDAFFGSMEKENVFNNQDDGELAKSSVMLTQLLGFDDDILEQVKTEEGIKKTEDLKDLVFLEAKEWKAKLSKRETGFTIAGKTMSKKLAAYHSGALVKKLEAKFPSQAYIKRLRAEKELEPSDKKVLSFLEKNKAVDLATTKLDLYFKKNKKSAPKDDAVKAKIKQHQRLFRLTPRYEHIKGLQKNNVHSAQGIVSFGKTRFVKEIAPKVGMNANEAKATYEKAERINTATMLIAGDLQAAKRRVDIPALNPANLKANMEKVGEDFPDLKSLFKLTDLCECEHCRSVYSPAAYMVETLQFLDKRAIVDTTTTPFTYGSLAKDKLFERRPDLGDLDLSCENANTPVPYIDLVCELLEEQVSPATGIAFNGLIAKGAVTNVLLNAMQTAGFKITEKATIFSPDVNGDFILRDKTLVCKITNTGPNQWNIKELRQTYGSAAALAAAPYYVNAGAYTELNTKKFAFGLPFDLNHTEAKAYFSRFDLKRAEMMNDFETAGAPVKEAIAAERLGLTEQERIIIVTPDTAGQQKYWNTTAPALLSTMKVVDKMLDKTGLTYQQLAELLELGFIAKVDNPFIKHLDSSCDTAQKEIANLDVAMLDRIHRFLRLWKKTGWAFHVLDAMVEQTNLGNGTLNDRTIILMAEMANIQERTGIKNTELIGCFGTIPHTLKTNSDAIPLYQEVFLDTAKNGVVDEGLFPEKIDGSGQLQNVLGSLSLIFQRSEEELGALIAITDGKLNWGNLSMLFATVRLCQKRKMTIADFLAYRELTAIDFFANTASYNQFLDALDRAKKSPLGIQDVRFMLRHQAADIDLRNMADTRILEVLTALQGAVRDAYLNTVSNFDDTLSVEELTVEFKIALQGLPGITEEIANTFVRMAQGDWNPPNDPPAATYIDDHIADFFDTTSVKTAQAAIAPDLEAEQKVFIQTITAAISDYLFTLEKKTAITQLLSEAYGTDTTLTDHVISLSKLGQPAPAAGTLLDILTDTSLIDTAAIDTLPAIDEGAYPDQYRALRLTHKLLPLWAAFALEEEALLWWLQIGAVPNWLLLETIPYQNGQNPVAYDTWESFILLMDLSKKYGPVENPADPTAPFTFRSVLDLLDPTVATANSDWFDALSVLTAYDRAQLEALDAHFGWSAPNLNSYTDPKVWMQMEQCMELLLKMNITVADAIQFIKPQLTATDTAALRVALKSSYTDSLWLDTLKEIMDAIRPQKRDALTTYLLAVNPNMEATEHLYDYFLVDTEMEACMPSSRIVQAHGTIQLFVQRCLMGLEPETAADVENDTGWDQWKWMRLYRPWEANRKVFLYPENWIMPELLDDKSFLFEELENELLQNELNEYTTEDAVIRYVEKLDDIAFLEVMTAYYEVDTYTMHVFARTKGGDPAQYYYRRFEGERYWTPWEKVALDISSDQLLAFKRNGRLHLAWPLFSEEHNPNEQALVPAISDTESTMDAEDTKPERRMRIQLGISQFANGMWKPKKISQDGIVTPKNYTKDENDLDRSKFNFIYEPFSEHIIVFHTDYDQNTEFHTTDGVFNIAGCQGYPELISTNQGNFPDFFPDINDTRLKKQRYHEFGGDSFDNLVVINLFTFFGFQERLGKTPGLFRITHPFQLNVFDIIGYLLQLLISAAASSGKVHSRFAKLPLGTLFPYFFEDSDRAFAIVPGMYGIQEDDQGKEYSVKRTFSDIHRLLLEMFALFQKYTAKWNQDPNQDPVAFVEEFQNDPDTLHIKEELQGYRGLRIGEQYKNLYHPLICLIRRTLYNEGVAGIMKREVQLTQTSFDFKATFDPAFPVVEPYPVADLNFDSDGSYAAYNWELFYHTPLMIANRLRQDQKFEEAMQWYHYMFDPTGTLEGSAPQKYWVTKPFFLHNSDDYIDQRIDTLLYKVADPNTPEIKELEFAIGQWREKPFRPHTVARFRPVAYQKTVLMNYIQNLIDWGDNQFGMDTMESIVQATQLYVLADKLLGKKPRIVPSIVKPPYQTYNQIENELDAFGNALVTLENLIPDLAVLPQEGAELPPPPTTLSSLYFCIPQNDKMLSYWDLIADRLFKIRNCQNIDGVERSLALFSPPIDPGALVKAAAAGMDISAILGGLNAPLPHYRFNVLAQKTSELVQEVRALGNALLQALEKKDAEEMALLRNSLERKVLQQMREVKLLQIKEAEEQITVLKKGKKVTEERNSYYKEVERIIPNEQLNLDKLAEGQNFQFASQIVQATGAILGLIPDFNIGGHGAGGSPAFHATFGGSNLAEAASAASSVLNIFSSVANYEANRASILGGYDRRWDDWKLQEHLSNKELEQMDQQIVVAEISKERNEKDLDNHDIQIENNEKNDDFMKDKYTHKELYQWMVGEITGVYFKAYQLAFDMAKKAEKCYQHELGNTDTFIDFGYWDSMKKGLLASDQLLYDLKRMEVAYLDNDKREYELTKHVSLDMLDPLALTKLKATGSCDFEIPEALFDMDHPGHYFRRLKAVSISIPCIAGPYTSVSGKLSLVANKYRKNADKAQGAATPLEEYQEVTGNDSRFTYNIGTIQSVATSQGQNDSGLFELNFRDERYLPFERKGAVSSWRFELPSEVRQFDYNTIRDIIVHVNYTAREGGSTLRNLAETTLVEKIGTMAQELNKQGLHKAISFKYEMPNEWHLLTTTGTVNAEVKKERLPYFVQPLNLAVDYVMFIAEVQDNPAAITIQVDDTDLVLNRNDDWQLCINETMGLSLDSLFKIDIADADRDSIKDLVMIVKYQGS